MNLPAQMIRLALLSTLLAALCGCGYTFQGSGSVLPPDVKRIAIPLAVNSTPEPGLALTVTEALRDRFERYGVISIVDKVSEADAVLNVRIISVVRNTTTSTSNTDSALQRSTNMTLAAELKRVTGPILWRAPALQVARVFGETSSVVVASSADFAGSNIGSGDLGNLSNREISRGQEQQALEDLSEEVARKIYDLAVLPEF